MSTENWKLESDLCRCCHSKGKYKNLAEPCYNLGQQEIYADMIRDCFNIDIEPVPGMLCAVTYTICDACIARVRDAFNFRKQVETCEEHFRDMYNKDIIKVGGSNLQVKVKEEFLDSTTQKCDYKIELSTDEDENDEDLGETFDLKCNDDEDSDDTLDVIKKRPKKENASKTKRPTKKTVKQKVVKEEAAETSGEDLEKKKALEWYSPYLRGRQQSVGVDESSSSWRGLGSGVPQDGKTVAAKFRLRDDDYKKDGDKYYCAQCEKIYNKFISLRYHIKTKHYQVPRFVCPYCNKHFMTPAPWTVHKLEEHNVDDRFNCNACKGTFNTKVQLRKHINNFHMLGERFKCEFCDYESFSFEGMYKHKFKHKTVKDYHCRFCKKSFLRKTTLDLHERIHTGDRRKVCKVCGQAFVQKASLNYHMTKYHPEVNF